jgi:hypothetical protein
MDSWEMIFARKEGGIFWESAIWFVAARLLESRRARKSIALKA